MTENKKAPFLQAKGYTSVSNGTATATTLAPGERIAFDEDSKQHVFERRLAEAGDPNSSFDFIEVDLKAEAAQEEEKAELLERGREIAAEQRQEELNAISEQQDEQARLRAEAQEQGQPAVNAGTDYPPQDVEAQRLAEQGGSGQRASTQADVVEESGSKSGRRSSRKG
jgi:hypothetical protein